MDFDTFGLHDESDEALGPELSDTELVSCPYCGESSELMVDLVAQWGDDRF